MRRLTGWSLGIAVLSLSILGCGSNDRAPLALSTTAGQSPTPVAELGNAYINQTGNIAEGALALYTITIDPQTLSATTTLKQQRAAEATGDLYTLPIYGFLRSDSLKILSVSGESDDVRIGYSIAHPFPAPTNIDGPATAGNRIDLGITGRGLGDVDYGNNVENSMIGPTFSLAGRTDATLVLDSSKNGRSGTTAHYLERVVCFLERKKTEGNLSCSKNLQQNQAICRST